MASESDMAAIALYPQDMAEAEAVTDRDSRHYLMKLVDASLARAEESKERDQGRWLQNGRRKLRETAFDGKNCRFSKARLATSPLGRHNGTVLPDLATHS